MKQQILTITENVPVTKTVYRMALTGADLEAQTPGGFVNIRLDGLFLRRPISVCDSEPGRLVILYKVVGRGTARMAGMKPGETLDVLTGLGNGYDLSKAGENPLLRVRPFRSPHHTISDAGLIGGGRDPRPGEISMAHNGVLFLDELPEFKRNVLEVLRQPLEDGIVTVSRASGSCVFPARFILCAAMNPCPCGRGEVELGCRCKPEEKRRYLKKISGPLLDRIDLRVPVRRLSESELLKAPDGESSAVIRRRVCAAREIQRDRYAGLGFYSNNQLTPKALQTFCALRSSGEKLLREAINRFKLSPRAYARILKVSRTIADLAGARDIGDEHIFEAISYRKSELE